MTIVIWAVFMLLYFVAFFGVAGAGVWNFIQTMSTMDQTVEPSPQEVFQIMGAFWGSIGLFIPLAWAFGAMMNGAVNRAIVRPEESAFGYLRLGMDELRLFVTQIALGLCAMVAYFVVVLVAALILGGSMMAFGENNPGPAIAIGGLLYVVVICLVIWAVVRLSLVYAITVAERRFAIFDSWGLTKGRFWSLLGCYILAFIMAWVVQMVAAIVIVPLGFMAFGTIGSEEAFNAMSWGEVFQRTGPFVIAIVILASLLYAFQMAIISAPVASAYLGLKAERDGVPPAPAQPAPPPPAPAPDPVPPATPPAV